MEPDPNCWGHLPSRVPLMRLFGNPVQQILCPTSLVFARPARKNQEERVVMSHYVADEIASLIFRYVQPRLRQRERRRREGSRASANLGQRAGGSRRQGRSGV